MSGMALEERVAALEAEVERLRTDVAARSAGDGAAWWKRMFGAFKDDPMFEEAMRLGAEYRRAQPTPADDDVPA